MAIKVWSLFEKFKLSELNNNFAELDERTSNINNTADLNKDVRSAEKLRNLFTTRPTSANLPIVGDGSLKEFKATTSMTDGKPPLDSHILHFEWDSAGGYNSQLAIGNDSGNLYFRGMFRGVWKPWYMVYSQYSKQPDVAKLTTARTISLTGDVTGSVSFDGSKNVSIASTLLNGSETPTPSNLGTITTHTAIRKGGVGRYRLSANSGNWTGGTIYNLTTLSSAYRPSVRIEKEILLRNDCQCYFSINTNGSVDITPRTSINNLLIFIDETYIL